MGSLLRGVAATLAFALEIAMLAAFAIWATSAARPALAGVALAILLVAALIAGWGLFLAPKASRQLRFPWRFVVELVLESASAVALYFAGHEQSAIAFGALIVARFVLGLATGIDRVDGPQPGF